LAKKSSALGEMMIVAMICERQTSCLSKLTLIVLEGSAGASDACGEKAMEEERMKGRRRRRSAWQVEGVGPRGQKEPASATQWEGKDL